MHELSIAQDLIALLEVKQLEMGNVRFRSATVEVGPLSGVMPDALGYAFSIAVRSSRLGPVVLEIRNAPLMIWCEACQKEAPARSPQQMRCGVCGTPATRIVHGRELDLVSIEVDDVPAENS